MSTIIDDIKSAEQRAAEICHDAATVARETLEAETQNAQRYVIAMSDEATANARALEEQTSREAEIETNRLKAQRELAAMQRCNEARKKSPGIIEYLLERVVK